MESFRELSLDRSNWVINQGSPERGSEFFQVTPNGPYVLRRISDGGRRALLSAVHTLGFFTHSSWQLCSGFFRLFGVGCRFVDRFFKAFRRSSTGLGSGLLTRLL